MRFAFDLDGTAWQFNATFTALAHALQAKGHEIGVLTGHMDHLRAADLHLWGSRGFPEPDFFLNASDAERVGIVHARPQREWKPELALSLIHI